MLREIRAAFRRKLPHLVFAVILTFCYVIAVYLAPPISQFLVDQVLSASSDGIVVFGITVFVAVCLAQPVSGFLKDLLYLQVTEEMVLKVRLLVFRKALRLSYPVIESGQSGDLTSLLANDTRMVCNFLTNLVAVVFKDIVLIGFIIYGMASRSLVITALLLISAAVFYLANYQIAAKLEWLSRYSLESYDELFGQASRVWRNALPIRVHNLMSRYVSRFADVLTRLRSINLSSGKWSAASSGFSGLMVVLSLALTYGLGVLFIREGSITLGAVVALGLYYQMLSGPIQELNSAFISYKKTKPCFTRLAEYLDLPDGASRLIPEVAADAPLIEVERLGFSYPSSKDGGLVFSCLSFELDGPGLYVVTGPSGCGKSTLLKLLVGLYEPDVGTVRAARGDLRSQVSYVSQDAELIDEETLSFNLLLRDPSQGDEDRLWLLIELFDLEDVVSSLAEGLSTVIQERDCFSGGERRRLSLARALLEEKPILLLDEITAGLDEMRAQVVVNTLREEAKRRVVVVATHDERIIEVADKMISL